MTIWNYSAFWHEALTQIKQDLTTQNRLQEFDMWFSSINYEEAQEKSITIAVPSKFLQDQFISRGYATLVQDKLQELSAKKLNINYVIKQTVPSDSFDEENNSITTLSKKEASFSGDKGGKKRHPNLKAEYTFDSFIMGDNSSFAYNAAVSISKNPGKVYNPVLIYGGVGLGKTHLMQAIGNAAHEQENLKIIYITAENFTNEFILSLNEKTAQKFKNKYRSTDILLIDDIHFLQNKEGTQEELFHTFNALYDSYKQIVFTCDRPISELKNITERLKSRFERGLNVDLQPPKYETRRAILEKKIQYLETQLPPNVINLIPSEIIDIIAQNVETNVRDLESCLTKVIAYAELVGNKITIDIVQQLLRDKFSSPQQGNISIDIILRVVAENFNISLADLKGKKRTKNIAFPRHVAMYISQNLTEYSTTELGSEFGGRDHTTVMHSCQKIREAVKTDSKLDAKIQFLMKSIKDYKK